MSVGVSLARLERFLVLAGHSCEMDLEPAQTVDAQRTAVPEEEETPNDVVSAWLEVRRHRVRPAAVINRVREVELGTLELTQMQMSRDIS